MFRCNHHHQGAHYMSMLKLRLLTNVTLARTDCTLPDDGDYTETCWSCFNVNFNPLNAELNPICYFLALLAHHFLHVSRRRVKSLTLR